jgi:hypothetical protein
MGCFLLLLLLVAFLCGIIYLLSPHSAQALNSSQESEHHPLAVFLLIDNSNSMFEKGGIGSDPALLRIDAARLFLAYLGVDEPDVTHQAGIIFFGTGADTAVPLTPLTNDRQRTALFAQIADPPRMGWTDHLAALQLAQQEITNSRGSGRPAVILLTDGKPEWPELSGDAAQIAYRNALQAQGEAFAAAGTPLFIILLANEATAPDAAIADTWQPLWQQMSQAVPPGRFFIAQSAPDLLPIYHDIVIALTGEQTAGVTLETDVPAGGTTSVFSVPPNLAQLTLVISKADAAQQVILETADGNVLTTASPGVRRAGNDRDTTEEVWVVERPVAGDWTVRITGSGVITIWQDYKLLPPTATSTTDAASALSAGVLEPTETPTCTPKPAVPALPQPLPTALPATPTLWPTRTPEPAVITFITPENPQPAAIPEGNGWFPWFAGSLFCLIVGGTGGLWLRFSRQPRVSGALRIIGGGLVPERLIDLDGLQKTAVTLGKPPADVPLAEAEAQAVIRPGELVNGIRQMCLAGGNGLMLDDRPVISSALLDDSAVISLGGGVRVRYENLLLRRAARVAGTGRKKQKLEFRREKLEGRN